MNKVCLVNTLPHCATGCGAAWTTCLQWNKLIKVFHSPLHRFTFQIFVPPMLSTLKEEKLPNDFSHSRSKRSDADALRFNALSECSGAGAVRAVVESH